MFVFLTSMVKFDVGFDVNIDVQSSMSHHQSDDAPLRKLPQGETLWGNKDHH
jgi:hypothetical protein